MYISPKTRVHIEKTLIKLNIRFLTKNDKLLEKYNEIGKNLKTVYIPPPSPPPHPPRQKNIDSKQIFNKKYLKAKIKSYNERIKILITKY